jgi:hypothetical protein
VSAFPYIITMAIFLFGLWLMAIAVDVPGFEALVFFGGILAVAVAMAVPIQVLGHRESGV